LTNIINRINVISIIMIMNRLSGNIYSPLINKIMNLFHEFDLM